MPQKTRFKGQILLSFLVTSLWGLSSSKANESVQKLYPIKNQFSAALVKDSKGFYRLKFFGFENKEVGSYPSISEKGLVSAQVLQMQNSNEFVIANEDSMHWVEFRAEGSKASLLIEKIKPSISLWGRKSNFRNSYQPVLLRDGTGVFLSEDRSLRHKKGYSLKLVIPVKDSQGQTNYQIETHDLKDLQYVVGGMVLPLETRGSREERMALILNRDKGIYALLKNPLAPNEGFNVLAQNKYKIFYKTLAQGTPRESYPSHFYFQDGSRSKAVGGNHNNQLYEIDYDSFLNGINPIPKQLRKEGEGEAIDFNVLHAVQDFDGNYIVVTMGYLIKVRGYDFERMWISKKIHGTISKPVLDPFNKKILFAVDTSAIDPSIQSKSAIFEVNSKTGEISDFLNIEGGVHTPIILQPLSQGRGLNYVKRVSETGSFVGSISLNACEARETF